MMKKVVLTVAISVLGVFIVEPLRGQAIVEYGKGLEGIRPPSGGGLRSPGGGGRGGGSQGPSADLPIVVLPTSLSVKEEQAQIFAQQDEYSAGVEKVHKGATLTPMGRTTVNGERWYLVRSEQGGVGWVKAEVVEEIWPPAAAKGAKEAQQVQKR